MDLALAHLRTVAEVARHQSFSRAAATLHLSQPAVSHHVKHVERALGVAVFERLGKRAVVTRAGEVLLEHARHVFEELDAATQTIQRLRGVVSGRVRIGTGATASIYLLPPLLRRLRRDHPDLELVIVTGNAPEIAAGVGRGELDLGIVTLPVPDARLEVSPFWEDPLVAVAPAEPKWRRARTMSAAALGQHPLILYERGGSIRRVIDEWFERGGVRPRVVMELGNAEALKQLVGAGLGLAISSQITVAADARRGTLVALPLAPPLRRRIGVIRRRVTAVRPAVAVVLAALEAFRDRRKRQAPRAARAGRPEDGTARGLSARGSLRG